MEREYHKWHSAALGREMELLLFGHAGARVLAFPTSKGRFFDWEDRRLVAALGEHLDRGWITLCCLDSVDVESWYSDRPLVERARRQGEYDRYVLEEVRPFLESRGGNQFLISTGASFGAYHAVDFAFRHPERVDRVLGMSGFYDLRPVFGGDNSLDFYYHNPCDFITREHNPARLAALRRLDIILVTGRADPFRPNNERLSGLLWDKGIGNALRLWDGFAHDWAYWARMLQLYLAGHD